MKKVILILCLINLTACIDFRTLEKWDDARVKKNMKEPEKLIMLKKHQNRKD